MRVQVLKRPRIEIDEHVGRREMGGRIRVTRFPPLESGERVIFFCDRAISTSGFVGVRRRDGCTRAGSPGCFW